MATKKAKKEAEKAARKAIERKEATKLVGISIDEMEEQELSGGVEGRGVILKVANDKDNNVTAGDVTLVGSGPNGGSRLFDFRMGQGLTCLSGTAPTIEPGTAFM